MRKIIVVLLCALFAVPSRAVLKEKNLAATLTVLRAELENAYREQKLTIARFTERNEAQHAQMVSSMQKSDQIALMLYSQKMDYTFDMNYACHEATQQFKDFNERRLPYDKIQTMLTSEIIRYRHLIASLRTLPPPLDHPAMPGPVAKRGKMGSGVMPGPGPAQDKAQPFLLDAQGQGDRRACLAYCNALLKGLLMMQSKIREDNESYRMVSQKLKKVNDYALKRYSTIQHSIFINGDDNYFQTLMSLPWMIKRVRQDVSDKYQIETVQRGHHKPVEAHSQWRGPIVIGVTFIIIFYLILATILSNVIIRWVVPKRYRTPEFMKKKFCLILTVAVVIFALCIMAVRCFVDHNFFLMASKLLIVFSWLMGVILLSLLVRLKGDQIKSGFRIYVPVMLMGFIVITFRIILIPNNLVQLIFPLILLLFTLWQWLSIRRLGRNIPRSDVFYTWISLVIMAASTYAAWYGYTLLSVQIFIWWIFQLSCIQTVTCLYHLLGLYEEKYLARRLEKAGNKASAAKQLQDMRNLKVGSSKLNPTTIHITWFNDLLRMTILPVIGTLSLPLSILWAADSFDLAEAVFNFYVIDLINIPNVLQLSLAKLVVVTSMWFIFRYVNYILKASYHRYRETKADANLNNRANFTLANNVIAIIVWGIYFITAVKMLRIPSTAISLITAGLATGIGFAMKDLLENFFYGISLMTGRVRVGDYIECDGIRGRVESITYQSTQIATADGSIIAFLNNSLFSKNFKNLTKNHNYELVKVPVGVAYGTNVEDLRQLLTQAVTNLEVKGPDGRPMIDPKHGVSVIFDNFGDNSINLFVIYWVLVEEKFGMTGRVKEAIYNTLTEHHIEIPFPQRDVYIRQIVEPKK